MCLGSGRNQDAAGAHKISGKMEGPVVGAADSRAEMRFALACEKLCGKTNKIVAGHTWTSIVKV
jgi:hypothetical protein